MRTAELKRIVIAGIMVVSTAMYAGERSQITHSTSRDSVIELQLVSEYQNNRIYDVTPDGLALLYYTNVPVRIYPGRDQPKSVDFLHVMEIRSGREIARRDVTWFPTQIQFIPDTEAVFYEEPSTAGSEGNFVIWNYGTGATTTCTPTAPLPVRKVVFAESTRAFVEMRTGPAWNRLGELVVPSCTWRVIGPAYPSNPKEGGILSRIVVLPDRKQMAHAVYLPYRIIVRDGVTGAAFTTIDPSPLSLGPDLLFSPDGKYLVAVGSDSLGDDQATRRYLLFYETKGYRLAKRLDVTQWRPWDPNRNIHGTFLGTALAISPDSKILALAQSDGSQAVVRLFSVETGRELGSGSHARVIPDRNNPWAAEVHGLAFSPDGKYLVSSTDHTRVWQIKRK